MGMSGALLPSGQPGESRGKCSFLHQALLSPLEGPSLPDAHLPQVPALPELRSAVLPPLTIRGHPAQGFLKRVEGSERALIPRRAHSIFKKETTRTGPETSEWSHPPPHALTHVGLLGAGSSVCQAFCHHSC